MARSALWQARQFRRHDGGVAAIEFAIVIPLLVMMLICAVDLGMGIFRHMQVQNSAQAGAQYAMGTAFSATAISNAVANATGYTGVTATPSPFQYCGCADSAGITPISCGAPCAAGKTYGQYVSVSSQATYTPILPYPIISPKFTLTGQAVVRTQ